MRIQRQGKGKDVGLQALATMPALEALDARMALIQALLPLGLQALAETLKDEVSTLTGEWDQRSGGRPGTVRWSRQRGSVYLLDQKLPITYQRVRDRMRRTYQQRQQPRAADTGLFRTLLHGLSCRRYEACAEAVPETFGLSPSTVSRRFIRASAKQLQALGERRLDGYDVIALGITLQGEKVILGFVQTATENERVCAAFLRELIERGLRYEQGLLCVIDGAKGLRKAIQTVFAQALVQRCQRHKREHSVAYLPKSQRALWRRKLQAAYERSSYTETKAALLRLRSELRLLNESAVTSLDEGLEETLTLHRLGLFRALGISLKTTNCIESLLSQVGASTDTGDRWRTSEQKHRWVASALLTIEPRLHRIKGYRHLPLLRAALQRETASTAQRCESVA